jgi:hypothetical protein
MTNDPFADLEDALEDGSADAADPESESSSSSGTGSTDESATHHDPITDTAFSYEDAQQRPFYARESTIADFDAWLNYELERELSERGYENIVVREMTDALLRTVVEEGLLEEVAARFEQAREDDSRDSAQ